MKLGAGVPGTREATRAENTRLQTEIAPIFLRHDICCSFACPEYAMQAFIDAHGFINAMLCIDVIRFDLPTRFKFDQWQGIGRIAVNLVG